MASFRLRSPGVPPPLDPKCGLPPHCSMFLPSDITPYIPSHLKLARTNHLQNSLVLEHPESKKLPVVEVCYDYKLVTPTVQGGRLAAGVHLWQTLEELQGWLKEA